MSLLLEALLALNATGVTGQRGGCDEHWLLELPVGAIYYQLVENDHAAVLHAIGTVLLRRPAWSLELYANGDFKDTPGRIRFMMLEALPPTNQTQCIAFSVLVTKEPLLKDFLLIELIPVRRPDGTLIWDLFTIVTDDSELVIQLKMVLDRMAREKEESCATT